MNGADLVTHPRGRRLFSRYEGGEIPVKYDPDDDIKDYAETTMNELLGWYGYEKVDSRDTQGLNLQHFASTPAETEGGSPAPSIRGEDSEEESAEPLRTEGTSTPTLPRPRSTSPDGSSSLAVDEVTRQHQQMVSALSTVIKHPGAPDSPNLPPGCIVCAWCQKVGMKLFTLKTTNGSKAFCSELCFTQCRRASFKKNKVCDWCKHVRHTVNYVDFQDGEQQLQFCSDKCLNQYKMNIFCKETQAHLQMHTHLKEPACKVPGSSGASINLITPDLWLRDCGKNRTNGGIVSPKEHIDILTDSNMSDDNLPAVQSPPSSARLSEPQNPSPISNLKENVNDRSEYLQPTKIREKHGRRNSRSSRISSKRNGYDRKSHHGHKLREKRLNGSVYPGTHNSAPNVVIPPSNTLPNGPLSRLSSPPMVPPPTVPPPLHQPLPPRLPPPMLDHLRPPFLPPNLAPSPFHILAQQQMEAFLKTQNRVGMRPDCPPFPFPPWGLPPIPHGHQLPHPSALANHQHPSPSLPHMSRTNRTDFQPVQKVPKSSNSKHSKHSHSHSLIHPPVHPPSTEKSVKPTEPSSLLPPVTVMVPFPVILPMPFPIPIPVPISERLLEQYKKRETSEHGSDSNILQENNNKGPVDVHSNTNGNQCTETTDSSIRNCTVDDVTKNTKSATADAENNNSCLPITRTESQLQGSEDYYISPITQNESSRSSEEPSNLSNSKLGDHLDSPRSFSSLSDIASADEETDNLRSKVVSDKIENRDDQDFLSYSNHDSHGFMASSLVATTSSSRQHTLLNVTLDDLDLRRTQSPLYGSAEKRRFPTLSTSPRDCKRHCMREGLNLVMYKESV